MKKFEYLSISSYQNKKQKVINFEGEELDRNQYIKAIFDYYGEDGWELVSSSSSVTGHIEPSIGGTGGYGYIDTEELFLFKREIEVKNESFTLERKILNQIAEKSAIIKVKNDEIKKGIEEKIQKAKDEISATFHQVLDKLNIEKTIENEYYYSIEYQTKKLLSTGPIKIIKRKIRIDYSLEDKARISIFTLNDNGIWDVDIQQDIFYKNIGAGSVSKIYALATNKA